MKTLTGKIARLAHSIREQLNHCIQNNDPGKSILKSKKPEEHGGMTDEEIAGFERILNLM